MNMIEKLKQVEERYNFINDRLCSPEIAADASLSTPFLKEMKTLTPVVEKYREVENECKCRAVGRRGNMKLTNKFILCNFFNPCNVCPSNARFVIFCLSTVADAAGAAALRFRRIGYRL